jgi:hypothetical protein
METVLLIAAETVSEQPQHLQPLQQLQQQPLQQLLQQLQQQPLQQLLQQLQQQPLQQLQQHQGAIVKRKDAQINVVFHAADLQAVANV